MMDYDEIMDSSYNMMTPFMINNICDHGFLAVHAYFGPSNTSK